MYCKKCGKEISEDCSFCPYCGCDLDNDHKLKDLLKWSSLNSRIIYIYVVWILLNSLLLLLNISGYTIVVYLVSTFITPLLYFCLRIGISYIFHMDCLKEYRMLIRILSLIVGFIPVFFILLPITGVIRNIFDLSTYTTKIWHYVLVVILVEFFYRDIFIRKRN